MKKLFVLLCTPMLTMAQLQSGVQTYSVGGRAYDITTPTNYNPSKEYPIVFELHSFGRNRAQMHDQNIINVQQYISVRPEGKYINLFFWEGNVWNTWKATDSFTNKSDDVVYITHVYNDVQQKMGSVFNPEKVFVYGFSNGGAMAMKLAEETSLFKAAVIRSMSFEAGHDIPNTASKIPMIFIHATGDEVVPYQGGKEKYSLVSPNFESVKETVNKWAAYNGLSHFTEIKYLAGNPTASKENFYFREYPHAIHPLYFFVIEGNKHATGNLFSNANIKRAMQRLIKDPKRYGIYK